VFSIRAQRSTGQLQGGLAVRAGEPLAGGKTVGESRPAEPLDPGQLSKTFPAIAPIQNN